MCCGTTMGNKSQSAKVSIVSRSLPSNKSWVWKSFASLDCHQQTYSFLWATQSIGQNDVISQPLADRGLVGSFPKVNPPFWIINIYTSSGVVGGLEPEFYDFPIILGISSSQLTNSIIFQRGCFTTIQIINHHLLSLTTINHHYSPLLVYIYGTYMEHIWKLYEYMDVSLRTLASYPIDLH